MSRVPSSAEFQISYTIILCYVKRQPNVELWRETWSKQKLKLSPSFYGLHHTAEIIFIFMIVIVFSPVLQDRMEKILLAEKVTATFCNHRCAQVT